MTVSKTTKRTGAAIGALVLLALGLWISSPRTEIGRQAQPKLARGPFQAGDIHRYRLSLHTTVDAPGGNVVDYTLEGMWTVSVLVESKHTVLLSARIADAQLLASGGATQAAVKARLDQAAAQFGLPITYSLDEHGALLRVADSPQAELQVRSMMRATAAVMQVVLADDDVESWQSDERDGTGDYVARYTRTGAGTLSKLKLRYTRLSPQAAAATNDGSSIDVKSSEAKLRLREDGFLLELEADESLLASGSMVGGISSRTHYRLTYVGSERMSDAVRAQVQADAPEVTSEPSEYEEQGPYSPEADYARIAGRSFDDIMAELARLPSSEEALTESDRTRRRRAFIGLAALFRREPATTERAKELIASGSRFAQLLWEALGSGGSPEAQAALRDVIDMPRWNSEQRLAQMISLSMVDSPSPESVSFMQDRVDDVEQHTQARYGLGTFAFNLRDEAPERASAIVSDLNKRIESSQGSATVEYLKALGNSGSSEGIPSIVKRLESRDPAARATALDALRFMEGDEINDWIARALTNDPDAGVRFAAASVAAWRKPTDPLLQALGVAWRRDPSQDVRTNSYTTMTRLDGQYPGLLAKMEAVYASW